MSAEPHMMHPLDAIADALFLVNADGVILQANDAACQSLGRCPEELEGLNMCEIASCPDSGDVAWWNDLQRGARRRMRLLHTRKDGSTFPVEVHAKAVENGGRCLILGLIRDMADFSRMEQELRAKQALLRATLQADDDGIMVLDKNGCVLLANERLAEMWRLPQKLLQAGDGENCIDLISSELEDPAALETLLRDNASPKVDQDLIRFKDGRIYERYASPIMDDGQVQGRIWSFRDVTERKWAEVALRESEIRYRTLFDQALDMIVVADAETGEIMDCNQATEKLTGLACSELLGRHQRVLHPPESDVAGGFSRIFAAHLQQENGTILEGQVLHVSGLVRDVAIKANPLQLNGRRCIQGIFHDISDYKRIQNDLAEAKEQLEERVRERTAQLAASEEKYRTLVETSSDWIWELDPQGCYTFVSSRVQDILGFEPGELLGHRLADLLTAPPPLEGVEVANSKAHELLRFLKQGQAYHNVEYAVRHKNGNAVVLESSGVPVRDASGALAGFRGVDRDITQRRKAESELLQAKNLAESFNAAKSRFLSSVTHELKTPINAVLGMAELLETCDSQDERQEYLGHLRDAAHRLLRIVDDVLDYSRLDQVADAREAAPMDVRSFFNAICRQHEHKAQEKGLELSLEFADDLPAALQGGWEHLQRALDHLLDNAVKFTRQGTVTVSVGNATAQACDYLTRKAITSCEAPLHVMVVDTGPGIAEEYQEQIFEAFFQIDGDLSREKGGAGMGLAVANHSVQLLGGRLWMESKEGQGSAFHLVAPFVHAMTDHDQEADQGRSS